MAADPFPLYTKPTDAIIGNGVLMIGASPVAAGATRGGLKFEPGHTMRHIEWDGEFDKVAGLDRYVGGNPRITGRVVDYTAAMLALLEAGGATVTAGTPSVSTVTPRAGGISLVVGSYIANVRLYLRLQSGKVGRVIFPFGLVTEYSLDFPAGVADEAGIPIVIEARLGTTETDFTKRAFTLEIES